MIHDPALLRLGKQVAKQDSRTLRFAKYVGALPTPPAAVDWLSGVGAFPMSANDRLGDCTCAGLAHLIQTWTGNAKPPARVMSDAEVIAAYTQLCGYNPSDPSTDRGGCELEILNAWRNDGVGGDKIAAYVSVNPKNPDEVRQAIALFGGLYIGAGLPTSAQGQAVWDVVPGTRRDQYGHPEDFGSWGGHCVVLGSYYPEATADWFHRLLGAEGQKAGVVCVTWGATKKITFDWLAGYCDEAYAILTPDWIAANNLSPSGFDLATLQADLAAITA